MSEGKRAVEQCHLVLKINAAKLLEVLSYTISEAANWSYAEVSGYLHA